MTQLATKTRAILVHVFFSTANDHTELDEFKELAAAAGAKPAQVITARRDKPAAKYYVGSGKAEEIKQAVLDNEAELIIINHDLSPGQERNLERLTACRVLDRTGLILDIFAQRAQSFEGKLQVELAQLQHLATRLVRGWSHLERQKGGIGLRGPGETQLETDRRLLGQRVKHIRARLEKVKNQRRLRRRQRQRNDVPSVALVGYTNTGKSTLFNRLTRSDVFAADQLFATLDPTVRRFELESYGRVVLADTVGFVRKLPHDLIEAFHATLEETRGASLLLHIVDASDEERRERIRQVNEVLEEVGAAEVPQLLVFNKVDLLDTAKSAPKLERNEHGMPRRVWVSAETGAGLDLLQQAMVECLAKYRPRPDWGSQDSWMSAAGGAE